MGLSMKTPRHTVCFSEVLPRNEAIRHFLKDVLVSSLSTACSCKKLLHQTIPGSYQDGLKCSQPNWPGIFDFPRCDRRLQLAMAAEAMLFEQ